MRLTGSMCNTCVAVRGTNNNTNPGQNRYHWRRPVRRYTCTFHGAKGPTTGGDPSGATHVHSMELKDQLLTSDMFLSKISSETTHALWYGEPQLPISTHNMRLPTAYELRPGNRTLPPYSTMGCSTCN